MSFMEETEEVYENKNEEPQKENKSKPSNFWYLLPIFFGIIGGIIGYFAIRDRDRKMAKNLLIVSIVILVVFTILPVILILAYYGIFAPSGFLGP